MSDAVVISQNPLSQVLDFVFGVETNPVVSRARLAAEDRARRQREIELYQSLHQPTLPPHHQQRQFGPTLQQEFPSVRQDPTPSRPEGTYKHAISEIHAEVEEMKQTFAEAQMDAAEKEKDLQQMRARLGQLYSTLGDGDVQKQPQHNGLLSEADVTSAVNRKLDRIEVLRVQLEQINHEISKQEALVGKRGEGGQQSPSSPGGSVAGPGTDAASIGARLGDFQNGVRIVHMEPSGPALRSKQIQLGDLVMRVDGVVPSTAQHASVLLHGQPGTSITLDLKRGGSVLSVMIPRGPHPQYQPTHHQSSRPGAGDFSLAGQVLRTENRFARPARAESEDPMARLVAFVQEYGWRDLEERIMQKDVDYTVYASIDVEMYPVEGRGDHFNWRGRTLRLLGPNRRNPTTLLDSNTGAVVWDKADNSTLKHQWLHSAFHYHPGSQGFALTDKRDGQLVLEWDMASHVGQWKGRAMAMGNNTWSEETPRGYYETAGANGRMLLEGTDLRRMPLMHVKQTLAAIASEGESILILVLRGPDANGPERQRLLNIHVGGDGLGIELGLHRETGFAMVTHVHFSSPNATLGSESGLCVGDRLLVIDRVKPELPT